MATLKDINYYRIQYRDPKDGKPVELKAHRVEDSNLGLGFIRISEFLFTTDTVVVQPTEVQMEKRFEGVKSLHLAIYSIISIEEVGGNVAGLKFKKSRSNLLTFPSEPHPVK